MDRKDFLIYCFLYAFDAANIRKQNLVHFALKSDAVDFVRIYNCYALDDDDNKLTNIKKNKAIHINSADDLNRFMNEMEDVFLDEENEDMSRLILVSASEILM